MDVKELGDKLNHELDRQTISASTLLSKFRVIDEASRKSAPYVDHRYIPFYYHLGKHVQPKAMLEIGFRLGLFSGCFFKQCQTVEHLLAFQKKPNEYYSVRMGIKNVTDNYKGDMHVYVGAISDDVFIKLLEARNWDLVIINEESTYEDHRLLLDLIWPHVSLGGLMTMDYITSHKPAGDIYVDFCKVHRREPVVVSTRYGVGLLEK